MQYNYTPGPWIVEGNKIVAPSTEKGVGTGKFGETVATIERHAGYGDECDGNSRLIAQAPAMLNALALAAAVLKGPCGENERRAAEASAIEVLGAALGLPPAAAAARIVACRANSNSSTPVSHNSANTP